MIEVKRPEYPTLEEKAGWMGRANVFMDQQAKTIEDLTGQILSNARTSEKVFADDAKTIERYEEFIRNGVENGYIYEPEYRDDPAQVTIDYVMGRRDTLEATHE